MNQVARLSQHQVAISAAPVPTDCSTTSTPSARLSQPIPTNRPARLTAGAQPDCTAMTRPSTAPRYSAFARISVLGFWACHT